MLLNYWFSIHSSIPYVTENQALIDIIWIWIDSCDDSALETHWNIDLGSAVNSKKAYIFYPVMSIVRMYATKNVTIFPNYSNSAAGVHGKEFLLKSIKIFSFQALLGTQILYKLLIAKRLGCLQYLYLNAFYFIILGKSNFHSQGLFKLLKSVQQLKCLGNGKCNSYFRRIV